MEIVDKYLTRFKTFEQSLNGTKNLPIHGLRLEAIEAFHRMGIPTQRNEDWKYTNLNKLIKQDFDPMILKRDVMGNSLLFDSMDHIKANKLVFTDGFYSHEHSSILDKNSNLIISTFADELEKGNREVEEHLNRLSDYKTDSLAALNLAFAQDGAFIKVPKGKTPQYPVILFFISSESGAKHISQLRNIIIVEESSQCELIESYQNVSNCHNLINSVTHILLKENARLDYCKLQLHDENYSQIDTTHITQERYSHSDTCTINLGGDLVKNNLSVILNDEHCETHLNGLYILKKNTHIDNHVFVDHASPMCQSNQLYKGLLDDNSTGVFNGKILVRKDAQKTNAFQSNKNILLSDRATINSKPQLEIFADDVKCSHGSTTGQMDNNAIFYLRTRGLNEFQAKAMLNQAFAGEVIDRIKNDSLRTFLNASLSDKQGELTVS